MENFENGQGSNPKKYPLKNLESKSIKPKRRTTRIPGPAGAVQAVMEQRARGKIPETEWVPTQEFIDRIGDEPEYDDSFNQKPWQKIIELGYQYFEEYVNFDQVRALQGNRTCNRVPLVSIYNIVNYFPIFLKLSNVNFCFSIQSLGIVTSVNRSYDGESLMLELKDDTGSKMMASVHKDAIVENEFQSKIVVGSVIVIGNVVVFNPNPRPVGNMYFNIVPANLQLLIDLDGELHNPKFVNIPKSQ